MNINRFILTAAVGFGLLACPTVTTISAQGVAENGPIVIEPLFVYPQAPDDMDALSDRSNWLMQHFWEPMDFKTKSTVDQNALNDAFSVYVAPMRFADEAEVDKSVTALLAQIKNNPALSLQFAKAAEESLYSKRAYVWNDGLFIRFIDNVLSNKKIKPERKLRLERIKSQLSNTLTGTVPPEFDYITADGRKNHYTPNGVITVIEFGDPGCFDCRMAKLKMDTDVRFTTLVDKGLVNVLFVYVDPEEGWQEKLKDYPAKWHVGASDEVADIYDIRESPSIYVIDCEGRVAAKLIDVETAIQIASAAARQ